MKVVRRNEDNEQLDVSLCCREGVQSRKTRTFTDRVVDAGGRRDISGYVKDIVKENTELD